MAQKVFNIIIKLLKEGDADKKTVSGLIDIKNALVAGAAITGTFAVAYKTVDKVLDETVGKFATYATGVDVFKSALSTTAEEGSRLIQVADDFGISAEGMQTAMFKAVKEGMEPTIEGLAGMADEYNALATPQERADFLVKNFGKSSQELTRLLGEGGQAIRDRAAAISDSLVLDEAAIQKGREYAFALDNVNDSIQAVKISLGADLLPIVVDIINGFQTLITITEGTNFQFVMLNFALAHGMISIQDYEARLQDLNISILEYTSAEAAAIVATSNMPSLLADYATATGNLTTAQIAAGDAAGMTDAQCKTLYSTIGTLQGITDDFNETQGELIIKQGEIIMAIDLAISQGYSPAGKKIQSLKGDLDNVNIALGDNAAAFEENSRRAIFAMMQTSAASDGWQEGEFEALMRVGEAWGIYSPQVVTQAGNMQAALERLKDGTATLAEIQGYAEWMIANPSIDQSFDVWVTTHENTIYTYTGFGCFIAGTLVTMADGNLKPIEEIQIGEWVLSWNVKTDEQIKAAVCKVFHHPAEIMSGYILVNGMLGLTPEHSVFVNRHWTKAAKLHLGDCLMDASGQKTIVKKLEWIKNQQPVYNLHTRHKTHNYFAGGVLVHNTAGKLQHGGPVIAGKAYIVGEKRPELFVPNQNGIILPSVPSGVGGASEMERLTRAVEQSSASQTSILRSIQTSLEGQASQLAAEIQKRR